MFGSENLPLDTVAHIIQIALTPVFLLSGIAALLNVFATRLARVSDRVEKLGDVMAAAAPEEAHRLASQMSFLHRRSIALDTAVVLGALGGASTCGAVLALFLGALRDVNAGSILFVLFGSSVTCTIGALGAFLTEMLIAGRGVRARAERRKHSARHLWPHKGA